MEFLWLWLGLSIVVGIAANSRGRSPLLWFILAIFISPMLAIIAVLVMRDLDEKDTAPSPRTHVKCPDCAELVLIEARVCKHCGCKLTPISKTSAESIRQPHAAKLGFQIGIATRKFRWIALSAGALVTVVIAAWPLTEKQNRTTALAETARPTQPTEAYKGDWVVAAQNPTHSDPTVGTPKGDLNEKRQALLAEATKAKEEAEFQNSLRIAQALKESTKNPDTFKLIDGRLMGDGTSCFTYRGANSFNAIVVNQSAFGPDYKQRNWNRHCGGKTGRDITHIRAVL